jgi:hypothetical protein
MKNVPGGRTDWHECQCIQFLHSVGLLRPAFRPEAEGCVMRRRGELVQMADQHVQHIHKALTQISTIAGGNQYGVGSDSPANQATINALGVVADNLGNVYFADFSGESVRMLTPSGPSCLRGHPNPVPVDRVRR